MKYETIAAFLALLASTTASPDQLLKRATCTNQYGYSYFCTGSQTTLTTTTGRAATTTTSRATTTTTSRATTTTAAGGSGSTGGASKYSSGSTANDITANTGCTPLTVIFARGTSEGGNIGSVIGAPLFQRLLSDKGASALTLQGVDYPADSAGNSNCGAAGGADMASKISTIRSRCPNTKIVISGYSQGACVAHNAVSSQGATNILGAVVFGDPFNGQAFNGIATSNVLSICRGDDSICNRGPSSGTGGHTSYGSSAQEAATFIEKLAGI